jgi:hypothetical protein
VQLPDAKRTADSTSAGTAGTRYLCLRAVGNVLSALLADTAVYDCGAVAGSGNHRQEHAAACTKLIHELLVRQVPKGLIH